MQILITGGTGFVGQPLVQYLMKCGHKVTLLSREQCGNTPFLLYPTKGGFIPAEKLAEMDAIINLAGTNISATRWNKKGKQEILASRIRVTRLLTESIHNNQKLGLPYPSVLISTSAVGYYGTSDTEIFDEDSRNGSGFLPKVAAEWEKQASKVRDMGIRLVILRFGIVVGNGSFLNQIRRPFAYGAGGYPGSGRQWISWIFLDDLVRMVEWTLSNQQAAGIYNACAPDAVTMKELTAALAMTLGRCSWTRMPGIAARLVFGEMAEELILHGQRVIPKRMQKEGFQWKFESIREAVEEALHESQKDTEKKS